MTEKQKTIKREISISGVGLHTGCQVQLRFKPASANTGINFIRTDLPNNPIVKACPSNVCKDTEIPRCTSIGNDNVIIHTVEHLMSVLCGLGINNLIVEIDSVELPGLDGSGEAFLKAIKKAGIVEQDSEMRFFKIKEPVGVAYNGSSIYVVPSDEFRISYTLDYDHPLLRSQFFSTIINEKIFEQDIAPCRTFCLENEANELRGRGLGKGATYENTLVVGQDGIKENRLRFEDEFARHKILDFIGDLYLLGMPIRCHVYAVKSGHMLNILLLKKICQQNERYQKKGIVPEYDLKGKKEIDINEIMRILPHRYPFLLVDRMIEIEKGKRGVGVKNVTMGDNFFQGHFPTRPVMPGVMMVEAMAQSAGMVILTNEAHHGKVAFFLSANNVKFRKVVVPGDQLIMDIEVIKDKPRTAQIHANASVNNEIVAEADMVFSFTDSTYLD